MLFDFREYNKPEKAFYFSLMCVEVSVLGGRLKTAVAVMRWHYLLKVFEQNYWDSSSPDQECLNFAPYLPYSEISVSNLMII